MPYRHIAVIVSGIIVLFLAGCPFLIPTPSPMEEIEYKAESSSKVLVVFLPGRSSDPEEFEEEGFIKAIRERSFSVDAVSVDANFGYYVKRTLLERLKEDVIDPAWKNGYEQVWLVGISMGGLGTLLYGQVYPDTITGIYALAPFLGDKDVIEEIDGAENLASWEPEKPVKESDYQRATWQWLKKYTQNESGSLPHLYIGWGKKDKFASACSLLAKALPEEQSFTTKGDHDWDAWLPLWEMFLDTRPFAVQGSGEGEKL